MSPLSSFFPFPHILWKIFFTVHPVIVYSEKHNSNDITAKMMFLKMYRGPFLFLLEEALKWDPKKS